MQSAVSELLCKEYDRSDVNHFQVRPIKPPIYAYDHPFSLPICQINAGDSKALQESGITTQKGP